MKLRSCFQAIAGLVSAAALAACAGGSATVVKEAIVVDLAHSQIGNESESPPKYGIGPADVLVVDASSFDFSTSLYPDIEPNAVQLVIANDRQYSAAWAPSSVVELSSSSLMALNDSRPFRGLLPGDSAIVAIGRQSIDPSAHEISLKVQWVGIVEVASQPR
jgi:hypothetical protein